MIQTKTGLRRAIETFGSLTEFLVRKPLRFIVPAQRRQQIKSIFGLPGTILHGDWQGLGIMGRREDPHIVLDIGAHHGWFFHCWLDWCPSAQIHGFELYPESFRTIQQLYGHDPRVSIHQVGVGAMQGEQTFRVLSESTVSNSFLPPNPEVWESVRYATGAVTEITVPVTTVDSFVGQQQLERIHLMKIDVQG